MFNTSASGSSESDRLISKNDGKLRGSTEELDYQTTAMLHAEIIEIVVCTCASLRWVRKVIGTNESAGQRFIAG